MAEGKSVARRAVLRRQASPHDALWRVNHMIDRQRAASLGVNGSAKHDHYRDFGWPETVDFAQLKQMYQRNPLATAAVEAHIEKVWESSPILFEAEEAHAETQTEADFKAWAEDIRLWQKVAEADRRSMIGDYAALILRIADGRRWSEEIGSVSGIADIWDVIPAWQDELTPSEWDMDQTSRRYGQPLTYQYQERPDPTVKSGAPARQVTIHWTRVVIWSGTGGLDGKSILRPGYNALLDVEKVVGGGAEGFWKNARQSLNLEIDPAADFMKLAQSLGVQTHELGDKINSIADDWLSGFDKSLMLQGIKANALNITLPQPEYYQSGPTQLFAASVRIPLRVMIGNMTGERASTEDERSWAKRCNGIRDSEKRPLLKAVLNRFEKCGALPERDYYLEWSDLTEGTISERLENAGKMAVINRDSSGTGVEAPFSADEIREAAGYQTEGIEEHGKTDSPLAARVDAIIGKIAGKTANDPAQPG